MRIVTALNLKVNRVDLIVHVFPLQKQSCGNNRLPRFYLVIPQKNRIFVRLEIFLIQIRHGALHLGLHAEFWILVCFEYAAWENMAEALLSLSFCNVLCSSELVYRSG